jgi:hypothetical protein
MRSSDMVSPHWREHCVATWIWLGSDVLRIRPWNRRKMQSARRRSKPYLSWRRTAADCTVQ